jgi:quercetin dioxygenase-like cupin family protein
MVKAGDLFEHPVTREKIVFRKTARNTGGVLLEADVYMQPGGFVAAEHIHPGQEERFEVIAGTLRARIAGNEVDGGPGTKLVVPPGIPHVWWNAGDDELHVLAEVLPALRFEDFFETFFGLAQDGKVSPKTGLPSLLQMAVLMRAHRAEIVLARPPLPVQTLLFSALAVIGRLLGYKAAHPYPRTRRPQAQATQSIATPTE